jgi:hypothetical protein
MLNQNAAVYRLAVTTGSKKAFSQVGTVAIMIQPMGATAAQTSNITFARAFTGFVMPNAGVEIGDYVLTADGNKYDVQGLRNYNFGTQPLVELTLQKQAQQGQSV